MDKTFTPKFSDYTLSFIFVLSLACGACSTHIDKDTKEAIANTETVVKQQPNLVTVAAIEKASDEVYFDLIAETKNCLGENLWLGGKLESKDKLTLSNSGAFSKTREYVVTELTATGLNSNNAYLVNSTTDLLHAKYDEKGTIYLQLGDGNMQLKPYPSAEPIVVAYQAEPEEGYYDGNLGHWNCK